MFKRVVTALCCGLSFIASAAQVTDLYQGKAPTTGDMVAAQGQALGEVLIKVTGKRDILTQPAVVKALAAPGDYVKSYGYQDVDSVKYLKAEFKSDKVNSLVSESKFALLGPARPQMALWLWWIRVSAICWQTSLPMAGHRHCANRPWRWGCRSASP